MNLTYRELARIISEMTKEQQDSNVSVFVPMDEEFYPVSDVSFASEISELDNGHPILNLTEQ